MRRMIHSSASAVILSFSAVSIWETALIRSVSENPDGSVSV